MRNRDQSPLKFFGFFREQLWNSIPLILILVGLPVATLVTRYPDVKFYSGIVIMVTGYLAFLTAKLLARRRLGYFVWFSKMVLRERFLYLLGYFLIIAGMLTEILLLLKI